MGLGSVFVGVGGLFAVLAIFYFSTLTKIIFLGFMSGGGGTESVTLTGIRSLTGTRNSNVKGRSGPSAAVGGYMDSDRFAGSSSAKRCCLIYGSKAARDIVCHYPSNAARNRGS